LDRVVDLSSQSTCPRSLVHPNPSRDPEVPTIAETAELLRAPVVTLRYWRHLGTGPRSFRLGRRVLYRRDDLRSWIDAQHDQDGVGRP
jgi:hypothetical protein